MSLSIIYTQDFGVLLQNGQDDKWVVRINCGCGILSFWLSFGYKTKTAQSYRNFEAAICFSYTSWIERLRPHEVRYVNVWAYVPWSSSTCCLLELMLPCLSHLYNKIKKKKLFFIDTIYEVVSGLKSVTTQCNSMQFFLILQRHLYPRADHM